MTFKILGCVFVSLIVRGYGINVTVQELSIGKNHSFTANDSVEYIFYFNTTELNLISEDALISQNNPLPPDAITTLKITTTVAADALVPMMFSIRYNFETTSWNLPYSKRCKMNNQSFCINILKQPRIKQV